MIEITETASPVTDIWPYVQKLTENNIVEKYTLENNLVENVYRNQDNTFDHVLLPTSGQNSCVVIVVDIKNEKVKGHFRLDLNAEYGLY